MSLACCSSGTVTHKDGDQDTEQVEIPRTGVQVLGPGLRGLDFAAEDMPVGRGTHCAVQHVQLLATGCEAI